MTGLSLQIQLPDWLPAHLSLHAADSRLPDDTAAMRLALSLARENIRQGTGGPFGALIVRDDTREILGVGVNRVVPEQNSCLHAEMMAFMFAQKNIGAFSLGSIPATLYTSCAPCAMCLGASLWSGISRLVISARREDAAAIGFDEGPVFPQSWEYLKARGLRVEEDCLLEEGRAVLQFYSENGGVIYNGKGM